MILTLKSSLLDTCHFRLSIFHCLNIKEALFFSKILSVLKILVYICVFWAVIFIVRVNLHSSSIVAKTNIIFERELRVVMCPNLQSQHLWMLHRRLNFLPSPVSSRIYKTIFKTLNQCCWFQIRVFKWWKLNSAR